MKLKTIVFLSVAAALFASGRASACQYHWLLSLPEPTGIWPTDPGSAASMLQTQDSFDDTATANAILSPIVSSIPTNASTPATAPTIDTYVTSWMLNTTGLTGRSTNSTINAAVSSIPADIQQVRYTSTDVYVQATGIPDYNIGPFGNDPNIPTNDNATFDIPRNPQPATGTHTATGLGAIGVLINGVDVFNMSDSNSYEDLNVWHNNAGVVEAQSFDSANAHPQQQGVYHNHENPVSLISEIGASSTNPMVIGFAIDGYPIMNDYASLTAGGPIVKMTSSYELRSITTRETTPSGTALPSNEWGPAVSSAYPLGYFEEDYAYVAGYGNLDQYNGAFVYTPQFPTGTYAYFATTDSSGNPAYPYMVGLDYYGTPSSDDLPGSTVNVPTNSTIYVPEPGTLGVFAVFGVSLISRRRRALV